MVPGALHEGYLKLASALERQFPDRLHFLSYASRVLRSIVVDIIREERAQRRGGGFALARLVEMRFFGGLTEQEIAEALGVSDRTVRREWNKARVLLLTLLGD